MEDELFFNEHRQPGEAYRVHYARCAEFVDAAAQAIRAGVDDATEARLLADMKRACEVASLLPFAELTMPADLAEKARV